MDDEKLIEAVMAEIERIEYQQYPEHIARAAIAVILPAVIEECARVAKTCHARNLSVGKHGEIELWRDDIHDAILALAAPRVEQEKV